MQRQVEKRPREIRITQAELDRFKARAIELGFSERPKPPAGKAEFWRQGSDPSKSFGLDMSIVSKYDITVGGTVFSTDLGYTGSDLRPALTVSFSCSTNASTVALMLAFPTKEHRLSIDKRYYSASIAPVANITTILESAAKLHAAILALSSEPLVHVVKAVTDLEQARECLLEVQRKIGDGINPVNALDESNPHKPVISTILYRLVPDQIGSYLMQMDLLIPGLREAKPIADAMELVADKSD